MMAQLPSSWRTLADCHCDGLVAFDVRYLMILRDTIAAAWFVTWKPENGFERSASTRHGPITKPTRCSRRGQHGAANSLLAAHQVLRTEVVGIHSCSYVVLGHQGQKSNEPLIQDESRRSQQMLDGLDVQESIVLAEGVAIVCQLLSREGREQLARQ